MAGAMQKTTREHPSAPAFFVGSSCGLASLETQHEVLKAGSGVFPEALDLLHVFSMLDVGCGMGAWARDAARSLEVPCVGLEANRSLVSLAQAHTKVGLLDDLVTFEQGEIEQPLPFAAETFDLVVLNFLGMRLSRECWPAVVQECVRVLTIGGTLLVTDGEWASTSEPACEQHAGYALDALWKAGCGWSCDGRTFGATQGVPTLVRQAGLDRVETEATLLDFSWDTLHVGVGTSHVWTTAVALQPFMTQMGYGSRQDLYALYDQMAWEMQGSGFQGGLVLVRTWGQKVEAGTRACGKRYFAPMFPCLV